MDKKTALSIYKKMVLIRRFEEMLYYIFSTQKMPGSMHQYNGQEAIAAAICEHLEDDDYITSTHRGHGHCLAKGMDLDAVMAEIFAKKTGLCFHEAIYHRLKRTYNTYHLYHYHPYF